MLGNLAINKSIDILTTPDSLWFFIWAFIVRETIVFYNDTLQNTHNTNY